MIYIGGIGGTRKTYVVWSILRLFELLGQKSKIVLGVPTGVAARLIGGQTIHSLTMLPDTKQKWDLNELIAMWKGKHWMISGKISMVGSKFLSQWSARIAQAKGNKVKRANTPFNGVNMIFLGDFGQLCLVRQSALYGYKVVKSLGMEVSQDEHGASLLKGALLWHLVCTVVILKRNQHQKEDPMYAALLSHV